MTVLVTGANGFVGSVVLRHLSDAGHRVRAAVRDPARIDREHEPVVLPSADAPDGAFRLLLKDVTHVVHCAALTNAASDATLADYMSANATLTGKLAEAAAATTAGRFVLLSSIRAVVGAGYAGTIDERTEPAPSCLYGRSKRAGELEAIARYTAEARDGLTILRLPAVYGGDIKGFLAALLRLADTPLPLPFAGLSGTRSVISSAAVARVVAHLLESSRKFDQAYIASDARPVTIPQVLKAYRSGLGRKPRLFAAPSSLLAKAAVLAGRQQDWQSLSVTQTCDPSALAATGWQPESDSLARLEDLARSWGRAGPTGSR